MKPYFVLIALLLLSACRIDLTVNGNGVVKTETGSFACGTGGNTDCVQSYVVDVTQCPGYTAPLIPGDPQTIPLNCTVLVTDYAVCTAMTNETTANCILDIGVQEVFRVLAGEGGEFTNWGGDAIACGERVDQTCAQWISADNAGSDAVVAIEANFAQDVAPQTASYTYNHLGQRKSKTVGTTTTYFVYSDIDGQMLGEYKSDGQPIRQYLYVEGERVAMFTYDYTGAPTTPPTKQITYFANNHIGQTMIGWNAAGDMVYQRSQTPFGETKGEFGKDGVKVPLRFPGQYYDAESGFNQNWNRDYDPSIGRYIQSDPIGILKDYERNPEFAVAQKFGFSLKPSGENRAGLNHVYAYVDGNVVMLVDPSGLGVTTVDSYCETHPASCPIVAPPQTPTILCFLTGICQSPITQPKEQCPTDEECWERCKYLLPSPSGDLQSSEYRKCYRECKGSL